MYVYDTSPSIESDEFEKVFDRHYRGDKSMTQDKTGSGLTICQQIISAYGAEISVSKSELGGVRVKIIFPLQT
nr:MULTISPECIES: ATP-binding protein [unclassified Pseudoalteromonas]